MKKRTIDDYADRWNNPIIPPSAVKKTVKKSTTAKKGKKKNGKG